jgi:phosphate transport system permease protein
VADAGRDHELAPAAVVRRRERYGRLAGAVASVLVLGYALPLLAILVLLAWQGAPALSLEFLLTAPRHGMTEGGIAPALLGTLLLVGVSLLASMPLGVLAAVWLTEYARPGRFVDLVQLAIVNLAGVPSIVHALFGVGAFVLFFGLGTSILAAGLTLAVMNLPVIIAATRESLLAVPKVYRETAWALGASRWQAVRHVVLPNALPGILTGMVFAVARAAGETAPILFTGVAFYLPRLPEGPFDQCMALSMHLFTISTQVVGVPESYPAATALVLIAVVLTANVVAVALRVRLRRSRRW